MSQGVVTAYLVCLATKQVDDHALVVWYDPECCSGCCSGGWRMPCRLISVVPPNACSA